MAAHVFEASEKPSPHRHDDEAKVPNRGATAVWVVAFPAEKGLLPPQGLSNRQGCESRPRLGAHRKPCRSRREYQDGVFLVRARPFDSHWIARADRRGV